MASVLQHPAEHHRPQPARLGRAVCRGSGQVRRGEVETQEIENVAKLLKARSDYEQTMAGNGPTGGRNNVDQGSGEKRNGQGPFQGVGIQVGRGQDDGILAKLLRRCRPSLRRSSCRAAGWNCRSRSLHRRRSNPRPALENRSSLRGRPRAGPHSRFAALFIAENPSVERGGLRDDPSCLGVWWWVRGLKIKDKGDTEAPSVVQSPVPATSDPRLTRHFDKAEFLDAAMAFSRDSAQCMQACTRMQTAFLSNRIVAFRNQTSFDRTVYTIPRAAADFDSES